MVALLDARQAFVDGVELFLDGVELLVQINDEGVKHGLQVGVVAVGPRAVAWDQNGLRDTRCKSPPRGGGVG